MSGPSNQPARPTVSDLADSLSAFDHHTDTTTHDTIPRPIMPAPLAQMHPAVVPASGEASGSLVLHSAAPAAGGLASNVYGNGMLQHPTPRVAQGFLVEEEGPPILGPEFPAGVDLAAWLPENQPFAPAKFLADHFELMQKKKIDLEAVRRRMDWEETSVRLLSNWMKANPDIAVDLCCLWRDICSVNWTATSWKNRLTKSQCPAQAFLRLLKARKTKYGQFLKEHLAIFVVALAGGATTLSNDVLGVYDTASVSRLRWMLAKLPGTDTYTALLHYYGAEGYAGSQDGHWLRLWGFRVHYERTHDCLQDLLSDTPPEHFANGLVPYKRIEYISFVDMDDAVSDNGIFQTRKQPVTPVQSAQPTQTDQPVLCPYGSDLVQPIQTAQSDHSAPSVQPAPFISADVISQPVNPVQPGIGNWAQDTSARATFTPEHQPVMSEKAKGKQKAVEPVDTDKASKRQRHEQMASPYAIDARTGQTTGFAPLEHAESRTSLGTEYRIEPPTTASQTSLYGYSSMGATGQTAQPQEQPASSAELAQLAWELTEQNQSLKEKIEDLTKQNKDLDEEKRHISQQYKHVVSQNKGLSKQTRAMSKQIDGLSKKNQSLEIQSQSKTEQIKDLAQQNKDLTAQNMSQAEHIRSLTDNVNEMILASTDTHRNDTVAPVNQQEPYIDLEQEAAATVPHSVAAHAALPITASQINVHPQVAMNLEPEGLSSDDSDESTSDDTGSSGED